MLGHPHPHAWLLGRAGQAHDRLTGHRVTVLKHVPWLRRAQGERAREHGAEVTLSALETVLVLVVFLGVVAFEIWFFFYSTSPIDQRTGRG